MKDRKKFDLEKKNLFKIRKEKIRKNVGPSEKNKP